MSVSTIDIIVQKVKHSRIGEVDPSNIQFGKMCSDHMLMAIYENGAWHQPEIVPFENLSLSPATTFFHYGQAIFEGVKAYKNPHGNPLIFRPYDNWKRMNRSAANAPILTDFPLMGTIFSIVRRPGEHFERRAFATAMSNPKEQSLFKLTFRAFMNTSIITESRTALQTCFLRVRLSPHR